MNVKTVKTKMICIICPLGCELEAEMEKEGKEIISIKGFKCPKGKEYATREITDPRRVLMAVVKVKGGHLPVVSVKTAKPIPKHRLFDAVRVISKIEIKAPIKTGDVIVNNLLGTGIPVIATNNIRKAPMRILLPRNTREGKHEKCSERCGIIRIIRLSAY